MKRKVVWSLAAGAVLASSIVAPAMADDNASPSPSAFHRQKIIVNWGSYTPGGYPQFLLISLVNPGCKDIYVQRDFYSPENSEQLERLLALIKSTILPHGADWGIATYMHSEKFVIKGDQSKCDSPSPSPTTVTTTPVSSPTPTITNTPSPSVSQTPSNSPSASSTASASPSVTNTPSATPSATPSITPSQSVTPSSTPSSASPSQFVTPSGSPSASNTTTSSASPSKPSKSVAPTHSPAHTPSNTPTLFTALPRPSASESHTATPRRVSSPSPSKSSTPAPVVSQDMTPTSLAQTGSGLSVILATIGGIVLAALGVLLVGFWLRKRRTNW